MSATAWLRPTYEAPYVPQTVISLDRTAPTPALHSSIVKLGASPCPLSLPALWPCPSTDLLSQVSGSTAWLSWNESGLHALFDVRGPFLAARDAPADKSTIHRDSRVEVFVCPAASATDPGAMCYHCYEFNSAGRCLDLLGNIDETGERHFDYEWKGSAVGVMQQLEQHDDTASVNSRLYRVSIPWQDIGLPTAPTPDDNTELLVGVYRGEVVDAAAERAEHLWTAWVDPLSADVTFHTHRTFARVRLSR